MPRKIRNLRWWIIGLLMLGGTINYLTRSTLGVAAPTLIKDLGITTKQYSWIVATFQGALMTQPLAGYDFRRLEKRRQIRNVFGG